MYHERMCHTYPGDYFIDKKAQLTFKLLPLIDADNERLEFHSISVNTLDDLLPDDCRKYSSASRLIYGITRGLNSCLALLFEILQSKNIMNTTGKIITGFLTGTLLGIVAGLLTAPMSGKRARKDIQKKSRKLAKQLSAYVGMSNKPGARTASSKNGKATVAAS
jgi:hypothetical protein